MVNFEFNHFKINFLVDNGILRRLAFNINYIKIKKLLHLIEY